jgi:hypothetical protein
MEIVNYGSYALSKFMVQDFLKIWLEFASPLWHKITSTYTKNHCWTNAGIIQSCPQSNIVSGVVFFLLGESPASDFHVPTFRNTLSFPSS